jgi:hypothetical protein
MRKYLIIGIVLCVVVVSAAFMMRSGGDAVTEVRMSEVKQGVLVESVSAPGVVELL